VQIITNTTRPHGYIRWIPSHFCRDNRWQHRLAALRRLTWSGIFAACAAKQKFQCCSWCSTSASDSTSIKWNLPRARIQFLTVVREVFIDLNKHAEEVTRANGASAR